jgi:hypothetical protein
MGEAGACARWRLPLRGAQRIAGWRSGPAWVEAACPVYSAYRAVPA